jgi:carboxypeptidase Taq
VSAPPPALAALRERLAELSDLRSIDGLLAWDQQTVMPPAGGPARAEHAATLTRVIHGRETDPALGALLDTLEPWADGEDPDADDVRLVRWARRDFEKAVRVPAGLAADLARAGALGQQDWERARAADDFAVFRDALARHIDLRHRYVACFDPAEHPYDVLLDDFEPGLTTAELGPLLAELRAALVPLVAAAGGDPGRPGNDGAFEGHYPAGAQRVALLDVLEGVGFDPDGWRLDPALHPFAIGVAPGDTRLTTRYDEQDLAMALYSGLHEFGHGLYEASVDPRLARTTLEEPVSLGVHESQSRLWENSIGRSAPFCAWLLSRLRRTLPGTPVATLEPAALYRAVNAVRPSLVRIEADETTYNLHIVLRFELEVALVEGSLAVDDVPDAWNGKAHDLLGLEVTRPVEGVLQDVHWSAGSMGYFPTYTLGNLMAAQLWEKLRHDLEDVDGLVARGDFAPIREWLRDRVHRHGRKYPPRELLRRATGEELRTEPFVRTLREKLADAGVLAPVA